MDEDNDVEGFHVRGESLVMSCCKNILSRRRRPLQLMYKLRQLTAYDYVKN